jgi:hypothetical protein
MEAADKVMQAQQVSEGQMDEEAAAQFECDRRWQQQRGRLKADFIHAVQSGLIVRYLEVARIQEQCSENDSSGD